MDFEAARTRMIEQQIRPWNVLAMQTLDVLASVRREDFVPEEHRDLAFADVQIPLTGGDVMLEPKVSARMLEALQLEVGDRVLEVGTGTGYVTALLCRIAAHVTSVEISPDRLAQAKRNLGMSGVENVALENGDAHDGWGEENSFDAILVNGSMARMSEGLLTRLTEGGRLVGIEGHPPAMHVMQYLRVGGKFTSRSLFETQAPRLKNAEDRPAFVF